MGFYREKKVVRKEEPLIMTPISLKPDGYIFVLLVQTFWHFSMRCAFEWF